MNKVKGILLLGLLTFSLASCQLGGQNSSPDIDTNTDTNPELPEGNSDVEDNKDEPINPDINLSGEYKTYKADDMLMTYQSLNELNLYEGSTPCKGQVNIVVVPVNFKDIKFKFSFNSSNISYLDLAFNGKGADRETDYWESVHSFYKKSSYGKLDLNFDIADPFTPSFTSRQFVNLEKKVDAGGTYKLCEEVYDNLKMNNQKVNFHNPRYDANKDGFVDGIWFIYNEKNPAYSENYWPYVFWYEPSSTENNRITFSAYANMSLSFLFENDREGGDAHSAIHETGHLLGLDDYYTYDTDRKGHQIPSASGSYDMMDRNIGDHGSFSKASLGWLDLKVPTKPGTFSIKPLTTSNEAIILADPKTYNGTAFDEYLILDYYKPEGLNELDSSWAYSNDGIKLYNEPGLRIYHIDARIAALTYDDRVGFEFYKYVDLLNDNLDDPFANDMAYVVGHSNTRSRNFGGEKDEDLIAYIPQDNHEIYGSRWELKNEALYRIGDKFDVNEYSKFFKNSTFNNGKSIDWKVEVKDILEDQIIVEINF